MSAACAIDFGTSNSTLALVKDGVVRALPLDPRNHTPTLMPTLMYFRHPDPPVYGAGAIAAYLENDLQGRLIQSVKRHLPSTLFDGTSIGSSATSLETLIGGFLLHLRRIAEREAGEPVTRVLLGRPARFSAEPERDALAESRLRRAAELAGFTEIRFQVEPVAAARSFERSLDHDVVCFVGDLGGGTSDFSLIHLGPSRVDNPDRTRDVLGVGGVDVAGNDVDARLVWTEVCPAFGVNATYVPDRNRIAIPTVLHHAMCRWHTLCQATTPKNLRFIENMLRSTDDPVGISRLQELIRENYGYLLFQSVERTKVALGTHPETVLHFDRGEVQLDLPVTAAAFDRSIDPELDRIAGSARELLDRVGIRPEDVDVAFLTGGTSQLRRVRALFEGWFPGRIVEQDSFGSVGLGLGVEAGQIFERQA